MAVVVVSHGKIKTLPAGRKRMERGVPRESGTVTVMEEGAGVEGGIHEGTMNSEGNPGQLAVNQAEVVEIQRRGHSIEMKKVVVGMEEVGTQMKVEGTVGNGTIVKIMVKEQTDGGVITIIFRGEVA